MGRGCTMDEWVHFERLPDEGRVPNSSYWYVHCRHCVRGYEQKQLVNAPAKLTGRRSAMKAHLKVCPMYATQYKMEQRALAAAAAAVAATTTPTAAHVSSDATTVAGDAAASDVVAGATGEDDITINSAASAAMAAAAVSPMVGTVMIKTQSGEKRKRRGEDVEASGPRGGRGKHCMMEEWEHFIRLQDEGYIGKSNFFYAVCRHCQAAHDEAPEDKKAVMVPEKMVGRREKMRKHLATCPYFKGELPSLDRRTQVRTGGPGAFLPLPTAEGIKMVPASALTSAAAIEAAGLSAHVGLSGSSTPLGDAAAEGQTTSARLALDEWQYFTRLQRKKDSAYYFARCNFCQQAFDNAPDALKNSMSPTVVMGRKSNMQTHLAKCPYVPKDTVLFSGKPLTMGGGAVYTSTATRDDYAAASKRFKMAGQLDTGSASLHLIMMEFLIQHRLPFEWVDTASARKLLRLSAVGANVNTNLVPTSDELRGPVLDELVRNEYQPDVERLKHTVTLPPPVAGETEAGASTTARLPVVVKVSVSQPETDDEVPAVDCVVSANGVSLPLEYVVSERDEATLEEDALMAGISTTTTGVQFYHGLDVARHLTSQLQLLQEDHQLPAAVVVASPSPVLNRAVSLLRGRIPSVSCVWNLDDTVAFCVQKALTDAHVAAVVEAAVALWLSPEIQAALPETNQSLSTSTSDWKSFSAIAQELLSEQLSSIVEGKISRDDLLRVGNLFRVLTSVHSSATPDTRVTLADTLTHMATLYTIADGFEDVQRALEVAWNASEQPLILLAHALHPHLRLRGVAQTDLTKLSVLSDLAVMYFAQFFSGRKPLSLRGDVTSFLHMSQSVFSDSFISEFPLTDDYYRYLRDSFPELAALMELLHSLSVTHGDSHSRSSAARKTKEVDEKTGYTPDEAKKLAVLQERWKLDVPVSRSDASTPSEDGDIVMEEPAEAADTTVVAKWLHAIEDASAKRMVDFSEWEASYLTIDQEIAAVEAVVEAETVAMSTTEIALPAMAVDDVEAFPATPLSGLRGKKVRLAQLFTGTESTTV